MIKRYIKRYERCSLYENTVWFEVIQIDFQAHSREMKARSISYNNIREVIFHDIFNTEKDFTIFLIQKRILM